MTFPSWTYRRRISERAPLVLLLDVMNLKKNYREISIIVYAMIDKGDVLCNHSDLLSSVDGQTLSQEFAIAHAERVEIAAILVADTRIAGVAIAALGACASEEAVGGTRMRGVGSGVCVCLPDVHLTAAGTKGTSAGVRIGVASNPSFYISLCKQRFVRVCSALTVSVNCIPLHQ